MEPKLTLVLGGASSGKSAWAERLVESFGGARLYLATAQPQDREMRARIARHRARRGPGWRTREEPLAPGAALAGLGPADCVLLDCATLWLSNHLLAGSDIAAETDNLLESLCRCRARVVVVSNEVGHGIIPASALARRFREAQGQLNIRLAEQADLVVLITAGLAQTLKGRLPAADSQAP